MLYFRERYENRINEIDHVSYILSNKEDRDLIFNSSIYYVFACFF